MANTINPGAKPILEKRMFSNDFEIADLQVFYYPQVAKYTAHLYDIAATLPLIGSGSTQSSCLTDLCGQLPNNTPWAAEIRGIILKQMRDERNNTSRNSGGRGA